MADPLSITVLGITICQGLVVALAAWKDLSKDVAHLTRLVQGLQGVLQVLESHIQGHDPLVVRSILVNDRILECRDGPQTLKTALEKLEGKHLRSKFGQEAWRVFQRTAYPLKKGGFGDLRKLIQELQDQLSLAMQVYEL